MLKYQDNLSGVTKSLNVASFPIGKALISEGKI